MPAPLPFSERFIAPDSGPGTEPYTCSFHWFRAADGRIVGINAVRSDDTGCLMLRVFVAGDDGAMRALIHRAPLAAWAPFATTARERVVTRASGLDALGRGEGWVAGSVAAASNPRGITSASFNLDITVEAPGLGPGRLGRPELRMSVLDFPVVHYRGHVTLDGEQLAIDAEGTASLHFGQRLVEYVYLATVADVRSPGAPAVILAAAGGSDLPVGGALLGDVDVIYAFGRNGVPPVMLHAAAIAGPSIPVGWGASIELADARVIPHDMLGEPARTASARATLVRPAPTLTNLAHTERTDLGRVMIDCRGPSQLRLLPEG